MNTYEFYTGKSFYAYEWLGAHKEEEGVVFRTYAPGAKGVVLLWNCQNIEMHRVLDGNFYEVYVSDAKPGELSASTGDKRDAGSIPELGRSPGEGNSKPLQYSSLRNPMDRGARWATVPGAAKEST